MNSCLNVIGLQLGFNVGRYGKISFYLGLYDSFYFIQVLVRISTLLNKDCSLDIPKFLFYISKIILFSLGYYMNFYFYQK